MNAREQYEFWLSDPYFDEETKDELKSIAGDDAEINDRFYRSLEFGTAGLRGVIGAGTNRMNKYTVRQATQGLANYIIEMKGQEKGVAIAFDSRNFSPEFATEAALVLNANGIKTYRFESLRPTPELSYAVRYFGCIAGINVTASHNPKEYNGYKVYWEDGAQITPPHDKGIMDAVEKVTSFSDVKTMSKEDAKKAGLYITVGEKVDDAYMAELKKQQIHPEVVREMADKLKIVYTPFNGAGNLSVRRILKEIGFNNVYVVKEQEAADGNFPTLPYPNPELQENYKLALELAKEKDADIILATDPDSDRLGVWAKDGKTGEWHSFTGNMSGSLIMEYIIREHKENGTLPMYPAAVTTIVTSDLVKAIAKNYDVECIEVLTGFKYIGEQIKLFEAGEKPFHYVFGLEESYGCLAGTYARDKDAVVACMMLCEAAAFYKSKGMTLWDEMVRMYETYGFYKEGQQSKTYKGEAGAKEMKALMEKNRREFPKKLGRWDVLSVSDYLTDRRMDLSTNEEGKTGLPKSNVLYYQLSDNAWCCIRPSGTEPKVKFYFGVKGSDMEDGDKLLQELCDAVMSTLA